MRKRITSLLLTLAMLLSLLPAMGVTASAAEWTTVNSYEQFEAAMTANGQRNVRLGADIDTGTLTSGIGLLDTLTVKGQKQLDLNGHTLRLFTQKDALGNLIKIENSSLTLSDSSEAHTGRILGVTSTDSNVLISVWQNGKFTMNGGKLEVEAGKFRDALWRRTIDCRYGGEVVINGGTLYVPPKTYERYENQLLDQFLDEFDDLRNGSCGYTLIADNECKVTITGGTFQGPVRMNASNSKWNGTTSRVIITGGTFENNVVLNGAGSNAGDGKVTLAEIKGGTYLGKVQAWAAASFDSSFSTPEVVISGGDFSKEFWLRPKFPLVNDKEQEGMAYQVAAKLDGGTFHERFSADKSSENYEYSGAAVKQRLEAYEIYQLADKLLGQSAIQTGNGTFPAQDNNSYNKYFTNYKKSEHDSGGYAFIIKAVNSQPTTIIPNAWGMKSVTLDTNKIDYAKDWKGAVERMDNSTAHTIKFEWEPLAQELKDAGYSYKIKCEHYISGSAAVQKTENIDANATSHTVTIEKGAAPKVYSYDLQLNLEKNGSLVGIFTNDHIVKLVVSEAADTFISTVSFNVDKADVGEPGELSFEAKDKNGNTVAIHPNVTWEHDNIQEGINHVSFTIPAPDGYTFSGENGKVTTLKFGGVDVIGYVDGNGALNYSFPLDVVHRHKADHVSYNAKYHWEACSCGQKMMNTSEKHNMGGWVPGATLPSGGVVNTRSCTSGCGYTETTIDYSGVKHVTSLVLNMENYPMDGMKPHNFVKNGSETKDSDGEYLLTERDSSILYPSFSITSGGDKAKLYTMNPEAYDVLADKPDFAKWSRDGHFLAPGCNDTSHDHNEKSTFTTGVNYGVRLFLEAQDGYAFYKDFNEASNFKLFTDMNGIEVETYRVEAWYYKNTEGVDDWITKAPADDSAGASKVKVLFQLTAKNEGDLNITLPKLKAGDDLKATWAGFEGTPNFGTDDFVEDCYRSETMAWRSGPSRVIHGSAVTGESVTAQAGQTYTLEIPAVNANVLAHITIKNPTAATKIVEMPDGAITVTYKLPAAADDTIVNGVAVSITPPAYGAMPNTTATVAGTTHCTASAVTWNPADAAFEAKEYTATVTLTANDGYTFASDAVFTINGHMATVTTNADGSVTLSYTFPALTGPHTHTYGGNWIFATPDTHIRYCTANDGSYEEAPHSISSWTDKGDSKTHTGTCADCGYEKTENHSWVVVGEVAPTVDTEGSRSYECSATGCTATKTESIPKLIKYAVTVTSGGNGTASANPATAATGTEIKLTAKDDSGYHFKEWQVVKGGVAITDNKFTMPAEAVEIMAIFEKNASTGGGGGGGVTTYPITVKSAKNGDVTASHKSATKGATVTLTVNPDKGYVLDTLTVLDGKDKEIKLTEKNGKYTFTMPDSKVTVEAMFKAEQTTGKNPFIDVPAGSYYEDAVIWAVDKGITTGTSATTFNPNGICTRAQAVTFLWRAAGSPAAKSGAMPFADVKAGSYYYDAVLWAVEQGITKGTSDTMFSPDATCTRAQIVTFLWRANGSPAVSGNSAFTDVASDAYYAAAVTWAEKNDVTGGIGGGLFGSNNNCTRAQIVTFIYRSVK
ncbi:S-layer homology domain-containing protein [Intestinimonas massiliensis (ex Afouda et al. 2020)]|uniref:S-layer homology domain-containing protein n=1 Tax=Intestinimonas massiliensis (ex Afouda et al. 2020) TaxID=1673721 RepID=A0ABS9MAA3_9FIRM|nr:S-layer homology domain-containing protein [Intestinimonas massiliensis (ex Afouda et al. 2020)]MCG4527294.1 S-layer homology domain-containing protein [Intestinimonas massiliensis (ex Afouda et al. 2020)]